MPDARVVVITGASAGIGAALARACAARGDRVVLAARRREELERVAAGAKAAGASAALAVPTDVTKRDEIERLRDRAIAEFGRIDVWVNNAGRGITRPTLELSDADFDTMMAVNVKSALYGMQAVIPHFVERGAGHVINISSFLGRVPIATFRSVYSAAKAALNSLTANVRVDLAARAPGVHVSLVMPGIVSTDFARNALQAAPGAPGMRPSGALASQSADDVAGVIVRLIDHPAAEVYTNPALPDVARRYIADVAAFEAEAAARAAAGGAAARGTEVAPPQRSA
jgi:short-subunit dehydrogenase